MKTLATYVTAEGEREVVLVEVPEPRPRFVLIDALLGRAGAQSDPRVIDDELRSEREAFALAADYVPRAALAERPADDYMPWDAIDDDALEVAPLAA